MPRLTGPSAAGVAKLLAYSNTILGAVKAGARVSDLWAAVRSAEEVAGPELSGVSIFDMNHVAGQARAIAAAEETFNRADFSAPVEGTMWAWAPWATDTTMAWGEPDHALRYQYTVQTPDGELRTVFGQTDWQGSIATTVGDIRARAETSARMSLSTGSAGVAAQVGNLEDVEFVSLDSVQILRF